MYSEENLFYYCKLNVAIEFILAERRILLSPLIGTNDPREYKQFIFATVSDHKTKHEDLKETDNEVSRIIREDSKVICFSECYKDFFGYEYSKMWAHYGDNHRGICLRIDKNEFLKENSSIIDKSLLKSITYNEFNVRSPQEKHKEVDHIKMRKIGKDRYLKEIFRREYLDYLFFTKDKEWESEREVRLLHFGNPNGIEYCSIRNSLKEIHLGVDFVYNYLPSIKSLCPDVEIKKMVYKGVRLLSRHL